MLLRVPLRVWTDTGHPAADRHSTFQEPYLRAAFGMLGLADDLTFVHAELTKSEHVPRLAGFRQKAADSLAVALDTVAKAATAQPR